MRWVSEAAARSSSYQRGTLGDAAREFPRLRASMADTGSDGGARTYLALDGLVHQTLCSDTRNPYLMMASSGSLEGKGAAPPAHTS